MLFSHPIFPFSLYIQNGANASATGVRHNDTLRREMFLNKCFTITNQILRCCRMDSVSLSSRGSRCAPPLARTRVRRSEGRFLLSGAGSDWLDVWRKNYVKTYFIRTYRFYETADFVSNTWNGSCQKFIASGSIVPWKCKNNLLTRSTHTSYYILTLINSNVSLSSLKENTVLLRII